MARLALGIVGAIIGGIIGGPAGAQFGFMVGTILGGFLFPEELPGITGPRLQETRIDSSTYGMIKPIVYGSYRIGGNLIWIQTGGLQETIHTEDVGGKGSNTSQEVTTYTYHFTGAFSLCEGPIQAVTKIWANAKLIWTNDSGLVDGGVSSSKNLFSLQPEQLPRDADGNFLSDLAEARQAALNAAAPVTKMTIYLGTTTQEPDPLMENEKGIGLAPAYRTTAYIVVEGFQLKWFGNVIPVFTAEVCNLCTPSFPATVALDLLDSGATGHANNAVIDPTTGIAYAVTTHYVIAFDPITMTELFRSDGIATAAGGSGTVSVSGAGGTTIALLPPPPADELRPALIVTSSATIGFSNNGPSLLQDHDFFIYNADTLVGTGESLAAASTHWPAHTVANPSGRNYINMDGNNILSTRVYNVGGFTPAFQMDGMGNNAHDGALLIDEENTLLINMFFDGEVAVRRIQTIQQTGVAPDPGEGPGDGTQVVIVPFGTTDNQQTRFGYDPTRRNILMFNSGSSSIKRLDPENHEVFDVWFDDDGGNGYTAGIYMPLTDEWLFQNSSTDAFEVRSPIDGELIRSVPHTRSEGHLTLSPTNPCYVIALGATADDANKIFICEQATILTVQLSTIVADLCTRVGLATSEFDVTELTDSVDGYIIERTMQARKAVEPLQSLYFFDGIEEDYTIKFPKRGKASVRTLDEDDLGAELSGGQAASQETVVVHRRQEAEMPRELTISYLSRARDYGVNTQRATRQATRSKNRIQVNTAIVINNDQVAKTITETLFSVAWNERMRMEFSTHYGHIDLSPADTIQIALPNVTHQILLTQIDQQLPGVLRMQGITQDVSAYVQPALGGGTSDTLPVDDIPPGPSSSSKSVFIDSPLLLDRDATATGAGFYWGASGYSTLSWQGAVLYESVDGGESWQTVAATNQAVICGNVASVSNITEFAEPWQIDRDSQITVRLATPGTLVSTTESLLLTTNNNAFIIGDDLIGQFATATLNADGSYTLSTFIWGRRGSDTTLANVIIGARFAMLSTNSIRFIPDKIADLDVPTLYRSVTIGQSIEQTRVEGFTNTFKQLYPYAPYDVDGAWDGSNNIDISFTRRSRIGGDWGFGGDPPIGEVTESYEVAIYDLTNTEIRTLTGIASPIQYTAANQVTDFGANQDNIVIEVFQMSADVGRGFASREYIYRLDDADNKFFTDFSEYATGVQPADWSKHFTGFGSFTVETNPLSLGGQSLDHVMTSNGRDSLRWDDVGVTRDAELYCGFTPTGGTGSGNIEEHLTIWLRASGANGTETGIFFYLNTNNQEIGVTLVLNGVGFASNIGEAVVFNWVNDVEYRLRFRCIGETVKMRFWGVWDVEPTTWQVEETLQDGFLPFEGFVELGDGRSPSDTKYHFFSLVTGRKWLV